MAPMINCPLCGKLTDPRLELCVHCGGPVQRAATNTPRASGKRPSPSQTCPNCHALVQEGDIICVACGTNLLTGQRVLAEKPTDPSAPPREVSSKAWVIGLVIGLIVLAVIVLLVVLLSRDAVAHAEKLAANGQTIQAADFLKTYIAKRPDNARAQRLLGRLQWQLDVTDSAAEAFERAAKLDPTDTESTFYAALCYALQNDNVALSKAAALLDQLVSRAPSFEVYFLLAHVHGMRQDISAQTEALSQACRLSPDNARARVLLAACKALNNDVSGAIAELDAVQNKQDPVVAVAQGLLYSLKGEVNAAAERLLAATGTGTELKSKALVQLGLLLIAQGKIAEAQACFDQVLAAAPENQHARFYRAVCLDLRRSTREALTEFDAISRAGGPLANEAAVQASRIYLLMNEIQLGLEASDRAQQLGANSPAFYTIRGRILARNGQINEARESFRNAMRSDPSYAPVHLENGLLFIQTGQIAEGLAELQAYLELIDPNLPDARVNEVRGLIQQLQDAQTPRTTTSALESRSSGA